MPNHMEDVLLHAMDASELSRVRTVFNQLRILPIVSALCRVNAPSRVWLANCYGRADFTGNRAAQVNWLSLSERIRWQ
jgi:hypothetical protein